MHLFGSDCEKTIKNGVHELWLIVKKREASQQMHQTILGHVAATAAFQCRVVIRAPLHLELLQFVGGDSLFLHFVNHLIKGGERRFARVFWFMKDLRSHLGRAVIAKNIIYPAIGLNGNLLFEDKFAVDSASSSTVQSLIQKRHGTPIRRAPFGHQVTDGHCRQRAKLLLDVAAPLLVLFRLARVSKNRRCTSGNTAKMLIGKSHGFVRFDVTENEE